MYGASPAADEAEIVLFGPGYGEAICVHVGNRQWLVVDSCINSDCNLPASLHYLNELGVHPSEVKAVVASHWHDDHVCGLATLSAAYPDAEFFLSSVFDTVEAKAFLAAYGGEIAPQARGARELYRIASKREKIIFTQHRVLVLEAVVGGRTVRALALSPGPAAQAQALAHFASHLPESTGKAIMYAPELRPNLEAIVLHIDFGEDAVLLGSDLENSGNMGWAEIVGDKICGTRYRAALYKVAHHGSRTGDLPEIWTQLLSHKPTAVLTPFNNGSVHLPTPDDKSRINENAGSAYITSTASRRPKLPAHIEKRMSSICSGLSRVNADFGAIRLRKKLGAQTWNVEFFGRAGRL